MAVKTLLPPSRPPYRRPRRVPQRDRIEGCAYVFGYHHGDRVLVVVSPSPHDPGQWRTRSTLKGALQHDYPRGVTCNDVLTDWTLHDLDGFEETMDRREALERLEEELFRTKKLGDDPADRRCLRSRSFLWGEEQEEHRGGGRDGRTAADGVLRHLERGW